MQEDDLANVVSSHPDSPIFVGDRPESISEIGLEHKSTTLIEPTRSATSDDPTRFTTPEAVERPPAARTERRASSVAFAGDGEEEDQPLAHTDAEDVAEKFWETEANHPIGKEHEIGRQYEQALSEENLSRELKRLAYSSYFDGLKIPKLFPIGSVEWRTEAEFFAVVSKSMLAIFLRRTGVKLSDAFPFVASPRIIHEFEKTRAGDDAEEEPSAFSLREFRKVVSDTYPAVQDKDIQYLFGQIAEKDRVFVERVLGVLFDKELLDSFRPSSTIQHQNSSDISNEPDGSENAPPEAVVGDVNPIEEPKQEAKEDAAPVMSEIIREELQKWEFLGFGRLLDRCLDLTSRASDLSDLLRITHLLETDLLIEKLVLEKNEIGDEACTLIANMLTRNTALRELHLGSNNIGPEGVRSIGRALQQNSHLQLLGLQSNPLKDEGGVVLAQACHSWTSLQVLLLRDAHVGDIATKALSQELADHQGLSHLDLSSNSIGDVGVEQLSNLLKKSPNLQLLGLQKNHIGNRGAQSIAQALPFSRLRFLNLASNAISPSGSQVLSSAAHDLSRKGRDLDLVMFVPSL